MRGTIGAPRAQAGYVKSLSEERATAPDGQCRHLFASSMKPRAKYHRKIRKGKRRAGERGKRDGLSSPSSPSSFLQRTTRCFLLQPRPCWVGSVSECNVPMHFGGRCEMASTLQGPLGGSQTRVATYTQGSSHDGARGSPLHTPRSIVPVSWE